MAELKKRETEGRVEDFLQAADENIRADCLKVSRLMSRATGSAPKMWGANIVGFGNRQLKYDSGRELDWMIVGFSPRKRNLTLYLSSGEEWNRDLLARLGKHKTGKGCLHVKKLSDVDENVLLELIEESVERAKK